MAVNDENLPQGLIEEHVAKGAKKVKESGSKNIFDSISPQGIPESSGKKLYDIDRIGDSCELHEKENHRFESALVIKAIPGTEIYLKFRKPPTEKERELYKFLSKYVGCIMRYYRSEDARKRNETSDLIFQTNFLPRSPFAMYRIPSGVPLALPRWVLVYLKERCKNKMFKKTPMDKEEVNRQMEILMASGQPGIVFDDKWEFIEGPSLIRFEALPNMPTRLVG